MTILSLRALLKALAVASLAVSVTAADDGDAEGRGKGQDEGKGKGKDNGPDKVADIVFRNGSIYTVDSNFRKVSAIAVKDGIITSLGSNGCIAPWIGSNTKVVDLQGRMMMPGLVDAHMHVVSGGQFLLKCNLEYQTLPIADILAHVQGCIDGEPNAGDDDWIEVVNMDFAGLMATGKATKLDVDKLKTKRPVILRSSDYHAILVNSRALALSNVTADTPNPGSGVIDRLPNSQEPSGILYDEANRLMTGPPPPTAEQSNEAGRAALKLLREAGITTFQDASASEIHNTIFSTIKAEGGLSARAYCDYRLETPSSLASVDAIVANAVSAIKAWNDASPIGAKPTLKWQAIKAFIDGVITYPSSTAAVVEPYWLPDGQTQVWAPDNSTMVDPYWAPDILTKAMELLFLAGIDAQMHTDGDLAVKIALDAAAAFKAKHPNNKFKLGLAHDELTQESDWKRFAELGVDAIMSYQWSQISSFYIPDTFKSLGDYRLDKLQCHPQIEAAGRPVIYGSDWPIDPLDEFLALKVGVTRRGDPENPNSPAFQGAPYDAPFPQRAEGGLTREQVIRSITINSARFLRADDKIGSLARGKLADLIVLENDFFKVADEALGRNRVLMTVVGGEPVFIADDATKFVNIPTGLTAKFPNHLAEPVNKRLAARSIGGFAGKGLSKEGKAAAAKLRTRGICSHKH